MAATFKCGVCFKTYESEPLDVEEEELAMQDKFGYDFDIEDCDPICPRCFKLFWGDHE
jgi:hypothetical protein